jgi:hypothetical protein
MIASGLVVTLAVALLLVLIALRTPIFVALGVAGVAGLLGLGWCRSCRSTRWWPRRSTSCSARRSP